MRVVVVGGGVAGPAVALATRQLGLEAVVLERREKADPDEGSYLTLAPNGLDALDVLGVLDDVRGIGAPSRLNRMFGATGRLLGELSLGVPLADGTVALTMKRSALAVEVGAAARRAGAEIRLGADVVSVHEDAHGVTVELADGATVRGDVVVAADGVRSRLRSAVDAAAPSARYVGLTNFGGITRAADLGRLDLQPAAWHFVFGHRSFFGAHPLPNGDVAWFVNVPRPEISREERASTDDATWLAWLRELVAADAGPAPALLATGALELAADNTYDLRRVPAWSRGRIVLTGDAVHAPAPSSGQGASMALEDAVVLARELAAHGIDGTASYERARRRRVEKIVVNGARSSSSKIPGPVGRRVQEALLRLVFHTVVTEKSTAWITGHRLERPGVPARPTR